MNRMNEWWTRMNLSKLQKANIEFMIELADPYEGTSTISMIDKI